MGARRSLIIGSAFLCAIFTTNFQYSFKLGKVINCDLVNSWNHDSLLWIFSQLKVLVYE